jgi:hybrid cluster-associated redox disulfide protein
VVLLEALHNNQTLLCNKGDFLPLCPGANTSEPLWGILKVEEVPMKQPQLEAGLTVTEVLARWPQTIPVFIRHRMACIGCAMAPFETLAEVAVIYELDLSRFLSELEQAIERPTGNANLNNPPPD